MVRINWGQVLFVLLLAAALRTVGLTFGQPDPRYFPSDVPHETLNENAAIHPDEYSYVQLPLWLLLTGERNPHFYHNPAALLIINYITFWATGEKERLEWEPRADLGARREAPFRLYVVGRVYSMLFGVLTVAAVYALARRFFGNDVALLVGLLAAASFPLVQHAHYAKTSSLAAAFSAWTLWAAFTVLRAQRFRWWLFALAGLCAGFAAGSRYDAAGISIVVFVVGLVLLSRERTWRRAAFVLLGWVLFPVAFVLAMPWALFAIEAFIPEVSYIIGAYTGGTILYANSKWEGLFYLYRYLAVFGLGVLASLLALGGLFVGLMRARWRMWTLILLAYFVPYSWVVLRSTMAYNSDQLVSVSIPQFLFVVGMGYAATLARWQWGSSTRWAVTALICAFPLVLSAQFSWQMAQEETRLQMTAWIYDHVPQGSHIHLQGPYNIPLDPALYSTSQTYALAFPNPSKLVATEGAEYLVLSDAIYNHYWRSPMMYPPEFLAEARAYLETLDAQFTRVQHIPRPPLIGTREYVHTASYWHNPALTLYCLTPQSCAALR